MCEFRFACTAQTTSNYKHFSRFLTHFLTALSYIFFAITFPISIFFCVKTLRQEERLVVFRLGKMIGKEVKEREGEGKGRL